MTHKDNPASGSGDQEIEKAFREIIQPLENDYKSTKPELIPHEENWQGRLLANTTKNPILKPRPAPLRHNDDSFVSSSASTFPLAKSCPDPRNYTLAEETDLPSEPDDFPWGHPSGRPPASKINLWPKSILKRLQIIFAFIAIVIGAAKFFIPSLPQWVLFAALVSLCVSCLLFFVTLPNEPSTDQVES